MTPTPGWLQEKLFERRIVFVTGRLDDALAGQSAAQIMTLDASGDDPIDVVLSSADGTLEAAFVLGGPAIGVAASGWPGAGVAGGGGGEWGGFRFYGYMFILE